LNCLTLLLTSSLRDRRPPHDFELVAASLICDETAPRSGALYRPRWESNRLRELAELEGSFIAEYRFSPREFDILHLLLKDNLTANERMSNVSTARSGSSSISSDSRLGKIHHICVIYLVIFLFIIGIALTILGGGRRIEAMRTHGVSRTSTYFILHQVCQAINSCPALALDTSNDISTLQRRAQGFKAKSTPGLFDYCCGAIDGLAIRIKVPGRSETTNQAAFFQTAKSTIA
jgi:hypothetical protein